jgi:hypothetical protein
MSMPAITSKAWCSIDPVAYKGSTTAGRYAGCAAGRGRVCTRCSATATPHGMAALSVGITPTISNAAVEAQMTAFFPKPDPTDRYRHRRSVMSAALGATVLVWSGIGLR